MLRVYTLICFFLFQVLVANAQKGDYFVSHYTPTFQHEDQVYFDVRFTSNNELIAANRSGVVRFDGNVWTLIPMPAATLAVESDDQGQMFAGCVDNFGRIIVKDGRYHFESLAPPDINALTFQIVRNGENIYFLGQFHLTEYHSKSGLTRSFSVPDEEVFTQMYFLDSILWIETNQSSYLLKDTLLLTERALPDKSSVIFSSCERTIGCLFGSSQDEIFYYQNGQFVELPGLNEQEIVDASIIHPTLFAFSTLNRGVIFYDLLTKSITGEANASKGLYDNELFAIAADQTNGLWIANSFGFSRVDPTLPLRSYSYFPGLDGNLTTAAYVNDKWYIGSSHGVFYFDKEEKFRNVVTYIPRKAPVSPVAANQKQNSTTNNTNSAKTEEKKGGLFARAKAKQEEKKAAALNTQEKSNKGKANATQATVSSKTSQPKSNLTSVVGKNSSKKQGLFSKIKMNLSQTDKIQYDKKITKELISTEYLYRKIPGMVGKCKQIIPFGEGFIAVTPSGLVEIKNNVATQMDDEPSRFVFNPVGTETLWVSSQFGKVRRLDNIKGFWVETASLDTQGEIVLSIYQDKQGHLWMAGSNRIFKVKIENGDPYMEDFFDIQNQFFDNIKITEFEGVIHLINSEGIYYLDSVNGEFIVDYDLQNKTGKPQRHLIQRDGRVWIYNGANWLRIEADKSLSEYTYLKLFPNLTYIDQQGDDFWMINDNTSFYRYIASATDSLPPTQMFLRELRDRNGVVPSLSDRIMIDYDHNSLFVELARPDYLGLMNVEYQYRLIGLSRIWSEWTSNSSLDFNYLPAGNYTLEIRSRDRFGRIQESDPVKVRIIPPYWQTWWFSALEVIFFAGLVLIASQLNRKEKDNPRIILFANVLTIVTIVMIIELLQNGAGALLGEIGSPILAFGIDVLVALLVFPIEQLLRYIVTGKKEKVLASK